MSYKGFRIDRKFNVYDLNGELLFENTNSQQFSSLDDAKERIDEYLESKHKR